MSERASGGGTNHTAGGAVHLEIDARRLVLAVFLTCLAAEVLFFVLDWHVNYGRWTDIGTIRRLFNNAREDGVGSWFAVTQTTLVAVTLWLVVVVERRLSSTAVVLGWVVLAIFFTYMAIDDGSKIHERMGTTFKILQRQGPESDLGRQLLNVFPSYTWQIVFLPAFGALGLFTLGFLWRRLDSTLSIFMVAAAIGCFVVAVSLDFVEGLDDDHPWNLYTLIADTWDMEAYTRARFRHSPFSTLRHFSKSLEECIEMFGNTLLWCVFLRHLTARAQNLYVRFNHVAR